MYLTFVSRNADFLPRDHNGNRVVGRPAERTLNRVSIFRCDRNFPFLCYGNPYRRAQDGDETHECLTTVQSTFLSQ